MYKQFLGGARLTYMFKSLRRLVRNFFGFSHGEAKGFLLLLLLLLVLTLAYVIYNSLPGEGYTSYTEDVALLDSLVATIEQEEQEGKSIFTNNTRFKERTEPQFFNFNPNRLSADSLRLLGLPAWLANRIVNYRAKGGRFRAKEDLRKIYGLTDSTYEQLAPYLTIPNPGKEAAATSKAYPEKQAAGSAAAYEPKNKSADLRLDINLADSLELQLVRGIGPVLSGRIVRFRQKLGGFVSLHQLNEVWGLDSTVVAALKKQAYIQDEFKPAALNINKATAEELAGHPYISPSQAKLLYAYRQQHGPFQSTDDLLRIHTLSSDFVNKIAPYILLD